MYYTVFHFQSGEKECERSWHPVLLMINKNDSVLCFCNKDVCVCVCGDSFNFQVVLGFLHYKSNNKKKKSKTLNVFWKNYGQNVLKGVYKTKKEVKSF